QDCVERLHPAVGEEDPVVTAGWRMMGELSGQGHQRLAGEFAAAGSGHPPDLLLYGPDHHRVSMSANVREGAGSEIEIPVAVEILDHCSPGATYDERIGPTTR